jgi:Thermolysin metallopeptidase, catalytic domain
MCTPRELNCIMPPHLMDRLAQSDDRDVRDAAIRTLVASAELRGQRSILPGVAAALASPTQGRRTIFDAHSRESLDGADMKRSESSPVSPVSVNRAFDGLGATRKFYSDVLNRDSIDGMGMRLDGYVHYGDRYNNAMWDGKHMVFGDGDGVMFTDFTESLTVIGHELTHGVTENTAGLEYHNQSGALNESVGRLRIADRTVVAEPDGGKRAVADRARDLHTRFRRGCVAVDEGPRQRIRQPHDGEGPPARPHE